VYCLGERKTEIRKGTELYRLACGIIKRLQPEKFKKGNELNTGFMSEMKMENDGAAGGRG
jgi:hypothetical protein